MSASQLQRLLITAAAVALAGCGAGQNGGPSSANSTNTAGNPPLYEAVGSSDLTTARLLLAKGANANQRNQFGRTPLHRAADEDRPEVVRLLLAKGADVPTGNHYGRSALHNAAKREDIEAIKFLIAHGARLNQVCEYGTPLDLTANSEIAEVLRTAGGLESATKSIASRTHQRYGTELPSTK